MLALLLAAACGTHARSPSELDPTEATGVAPAAATHAPVSLVAVVTSRVAKVITPQSDGTVVRLLVHEDQYVHAGDVLIQLDVSELRSKLDAAKAELDSAQAEAARAGAVAAQAARKAVLEDRLMKLGASAPEAYRSARSDANAAYADSGVAAGKIKEASAQIEELTREIAAANITAPMDGVVSAIKIREGEMAHKGAPLARVFDPNDRVIKFAVPRAEVSLVHAGQHVDLVYDDHHAGAIVQAIDDDHDPAIDFLEVEAALDKTQSNTDDLRVGISGHVLVAQQDNKKGVGR